MTIGYLGLTSAEAERLLSLCGCVSDRLQRACCRRRRSPFILANRGRPRLCPIARGVSRQAAPEHQSNWVCFVLAVGAPSRLTRRSRRPKRRAERPSPCVPPSRASATGARPDPAAALSHMQQIDVTQPQPFESVKLLKLIKVDWKGKPSRQGFTRSSVSSRNPGIPGCTMSSTERWRICWCCAASKKSSSLVKPLVVTVG